jgi:hypothetical protein
VSAAAPCSSSTCSKLSYELRDVRERWVRFHALPGSTRYPDTEAEYAIVLARRNAVLSELVTGTELLIITTGGSSTPQPQGQCRPEEIVAAQPHSTYWTSVCTDDEPGHEYWIHLYVGLALWSPGSLDELLRQVADGVIYDVVVTDVDLRWLYHPYDGGMDVMLPSTVDRDLMCEQRRDWLSVHLLGRGRGCGLQ